MGTSSKSPIWTKSFISVFLGNFFLFLTFYALLTTLPVYVLDILNGTEAQGGLMVTVFLISAIIVRPFSGSLLDRFGKKKLLVICMAVFMACSFVYMIIENFYALLALRLFHGIWFSIATTATGAIAADLVPASRRGEGLGYFAMSMNVAVVAGPFIGLTLLQTISYEVMFFVLSVFMIGAIFFSFMTEVPEKREQPQTKRKLGWSDLFEIKAIPIALITCMVAFTYSSIISFISIFTKSIGLLEAASYFFVVFALAMLLTRPFTGKLFDAKGPKFVIYPSLVLFGIGLVLLSVTNSVILLIASAALVGAGYGSLVPCFQTLAVQSTDIHRSGHATATFFTFMDLGVAAGSVVLGIFVSNFGYRPLYLSLSIFILLIIFCYNLLNRKSAKTYLHVKDPHPE